MKRTLFTLLLPAALLLGNLSFAQDVPISVSVKSGTVTVDKAPVAGDWQISSLLSALGSNYRLRDGYNKVYTYDQYGMVAYERKNDETGTGELLEIQIYFGPVEANNVTPTGLFNGKASIEKVVLNRNTASQAILPKLKKYSQSDSYKEHNYRLAYKGVYIYFFFNDTEQELLKISIGQDKKSN